MTSAPAPRKSGRAPLVLAGLALAVAVGGTGGPAIARAMAPNADKVDGFHAVGAKAKAAKRAGKVVATNRDGRLPSDIIEQPALQLPEVLPAGTTMRGAWGIDTYDPTAARAGSWGTTISFPVPVPEGMQLKLLAEGELSEECAGPNYEPTAAPGWVCVYTSYGDTLHAPSGQMSTRFGVSVWANDDSSEGGVTWIGTWAATAPS